MGDDLVKSYTVVGLFGWKRYKHIPDASKLGDTLLDEVERIVRVDFDYFYSPVTNIEKRIILNLEHCKIPVTISRPKYTRIWRIDIGGAKYRYTSPYRIEVDR